MKRWFIAAIAIGTLTAQTVHQKVITGAVVDTLSPVVRNIGQASHIASAVFSDAPGLTCEPSGNPLSFNSPVLEITASFNDAVNSYWSVTSAHRVLLPATWAVNNRYRMLAMASGSYPYIKVYVGNINAPNCVVDVWYSGSLNHLDAKRIGEINAPYDGLTTVPFNTGVAAVTTLAGSISQVRHVVYAMVLYNSTAQNVTIQDTRVDKVAVPLYTLAAFCAGCSVPLPNTGQPHFQTSQGGILQIATSGPTAVSGFVTYREE